MTKRNTHVWAVFVFVLWLSPATVTTAFGLWASRCLRHQSRRCLTTSWAVGYGGDSGTNHAETNLRIGTADTHVRQAERTTTTTKRVSMHIAGATTSFLLASQIAAAAVSFDSGRILPPQPHEVSLEQQAIPTRSEDARNAFDDSTWTLASQNQASLLESASSAICSQWQWEERDTQQRLGRLVAAVEDFLGITSVKSVLCPQTRPAFAAEGDDGNRPQQWMFQLQNLDLSATTSSVFSALGAGILLSLAQAAIALFQYRTNPTGHLVIPAGLTVGVEHPTNSAELNEDDEMGGSEEATPWFTTPATNATDEDADSFVPFPTWMKEMDSMWAQSAQDEELQSSGWIMSTTQHSSDTSPSSPYATNDTKDSEVAATDSPSGYARILRRLNRFMVLLLPWIARNLNQVLLKQAHLTHIFIILAVVELWDTLRPLVDATKSEEEENETKVLDDIYPRTTPSQPIRRLLVLGDSLSVGLGSIDQFKVRPPDMPFFQLIENTDTATTPTKEQGPVFPQVLAATLAQQQNCSVSWRSAGVDGGAVSHIREYLLPVLEQEVQSGHVPDCIVVLCGMNDLKYQFASQPWNFLSSETFQHELEELFKDIDRICCHDSEDAETTADATRCNTQVVLPAMPLQTVLQNSAVGIFPLSVLLGSLVGYWDSQKKHMADQHEGNMPIRYLPLPSDIVEEWYAREEINSSDRSSAGRIETVHHAAADEGFVSVDGIHPNARCYGLWAKFVAKSLVETGGGLGVDETTDATLSRDQKILKGIAQPW